MLEQSRRKKSGKKMVNDERRKGKEGERQKGGRGEVEGEEKEEEGRRLTYNILGRNFPL